jgi:hypothetical protein
MSSTDSGLTSSAKSIKLRNTLTETNYLLFYKELCDHLPIFGEAGTELTSLKYWKIPTKPKRTDIVLYNSTNKNGKDEQRTRQWTPTIDEPIFREDVRIHETKLTRYETHRAQLWRVIIENLSDTIRMSVQLDNAKYEALRDKVDTLGLFLHIKEIVELNGINKASKMRIKWQELKQVNPVTGTVTPLVDFLTQFESLLGLLNLTPSKIYRVRYSRCPQRCSYAPTL